MQTKKKSFFSRIGFEHNDNTLDYLGSPLKESIVSEFPKVIEANPNRDIIFSICQLENFNVIWKNNNLDSANVFLDQLIQHLNNECDVIGKRISMSKFIIIKTIKKDDNITSIIENIFTTIREFSYKNKLNNIFCVIKSGVDVYNKSNNNDINTIVNHSYLALEECKHKEGLKYCIYNEFQDYVKEASDKMGLACFFQKAYFENQLLLAYQPVIDSQTGKIRHYECLLRIKTENGDIVSAGPIIPIAEEMGFIDTIDHYVLELVAKELLAYPDIKLGMNISNVITESKLWINKAKALLSQNNIASRLTIEITETGVSRDLNKVALFVKEMQDLGCQIAIDDFGTGYTSFKQLKLLNADVVKIDGLFIKDITNNKQNKLFVETLISFAKGFGIKTVAEFVENSDIAKTLTELGIDYMQGHYFSKAILDKPWEK